MPRKAKEDSGAARNGRPDGRLMRREGGGMSTAWLLARSDSFGRALNRKGMPMVWGKGDGVRTDDAWRLDEEYRREDGRGR